MKRAQLNIIILAIYLALGIGLLAGLLSFGSQMSAVKDNADAPVDSGKFTAYEILIADELSFYEGQETVIVPYLMSVDGSIKNTRFEYTSSTDAITVDNVGNVKVLRDPGTDAYITITDLKTGATKTVKINVISSLSSVLGILDSTGHLINGNKQSFTTGKAVQYTVNTEPAGIDISGLCSVKIYDNTGKEKSAFEVSYSRNTIKLNPVGIGEGRMVITVKNDEGEVLNTTEFDFSIHMENKSLSEEILNRSGLSLMVGSDFNSINTLTIDGSITDMSTLNILTNLKTLYINSSSVVNLKNLRTGISYRVPESVFLNYCQSDNWKDYLGNILPYNTNDTSKLYVVYHDSNNETINYAQISKDMNLPQYNELNGQKHTGWLNAKGEAITAANVRNAKDSLHIYAKWTSVDCKIVYHIDIFGEEYTENWSYDKVKGLKEITSFPKYKPLNGYQFLGWSTSSWSYDVVYVNGQPLAELSGVGDGATIHLYAVWDIFTYYIEFRNYDDSPYTGNLPGRITVEGGDSYVLPDYIVGAGYEFDGWRCEEKGKTLQPGENTYPLADEDGQVVILYAKVDESKYMIRFDFDGASCLNKDGNEVRNSFDISLKYSDTYTVPIPYKDGYDFLYWKDAKGNIYYGYSIIGQLSNQMVLITLTAVFTPK